MIKVDLITGNLGAGKTTFIKKYVSYLVSEGMRVGILENDHGAVNVDMLMLNELRSDKCELEMVAGGCDVDCHRRRFKTKLISMAMSGYDRVVIEPSGVFDVDEFFDALREEPLDNWYEIGNVFCIVNAYLDNPDYLFASQVANAGQIVLSHVSEFVSQNGTGKSLVEEDIATITQKINDALNNVGCKRVFSTDEIFSKNWDELETADYEKLLRAGFKVSDFVKKYSLEELGYETLIYFNVNFLEKELIEKINTLFRETNTVRFKGYIKTEDGWIEVNATKTSIKINPVQVGQEVLIVIGKGLIKEHVNTIIGALSVQEGGTV